MIKIAYNLQNLIINKLSEDRSPGYVGVPKSTGWDGYGVYEREGQPRRYLRLTPPQPASATPLSGRAALREQLRPFTDQLKPITNATERMFSPYTNSRVAKQMFPSATTQATTPVQPAAPTSLAAFQQQSAPMPTPSGPVTPQAPMSSTLKPDENQYSLLRNVASFMGIGPLLQQTDQILHNKHPYFSLHGRSERPPVASASPIPPYNRVY